MVAYIEQKLKMDSLSYRIKIYQGWRLSDWS